MKYQFTIDGRPAAPAREHWTQAAQDAVDARYADWGKEPDAVVFFVGGGGTVCTIQDVTDAS